MAHGAHMLHTLLAPGMPLMHSVPVHNHITKFIMYFTVLSALAILLASNPGLAI